MPTGSHQHNSTHPPLRWRRSHVAILIALWAAIYLLSTWSPPLLDDADATHAQAAQAMLHTGDWVTLHVDGIRYLEKPPLPYWIAAVSLRVFGNDSFAIHLPLAFTVLGLALLGYGWSLRAFDETAALYSALFVLTSVGTFLFTRIFIPDALLSLLLAACLYGFLRAIEPASEPSPHFAYAMWTALALAVLAKGLVAIVFFLGATLLYLAFSPALRSPSLLRRRLFPVSGIALFLLIAAPWHVVAGLRNTGGGDGHGFLWFYFVNEHVLRFLGRRIPRDYNKLPFTLYWVLHLVWLFPWSFFVPAAAIVAWQRRAGVRLHSSFYLKSRNLGSGDFGRQTALLLGIFSALVLLFFAFSTNQEYYTFPVYLPVLMLIAAALASSRNAAKSDPVQRAVRLGLIAFTLIGLAAATALGYGLWTSRHLPFVADIGALLAHRGVGNYTLSMSHFFDLTGPSFAALRTPAMVAALALALGPAAALLLYVRGRRTVSIFIVAVTSAMFLVAAHLALVRFAPMLSSSGFADTITHLETVGAISPDSEVLLYGDQAYGSSLPFYLQRQVGLVNGRSTSMLFGSTFPDAPPIFLSSADLLSGWGFGRRKLLFVPLEKRDEAGALLGSRVIVLGEISGKALLTDRPVRYPAENPQ